MEQENKQTRMTLILIKEKIKKKKRKKRETRTYENRKVLKKKSSNK